jgi:hypothetical protein
MSQYKCRLDNNKDVIYGFDAPTGGYYISIFGEKEKVLFEEDGLVLSKLVFMLKQNGILNYNIDKMIHDFYKASPPSPLQIFVMQAVGKDIKDLLNNCETNIKLQFVGDRFL